MRNRNAGDRTKFLPSEILIRRPGIPGPEGVPTDGGRSAVAWLPWVLCGFFVLGAVAGLADGRPVDGVRVGGTAVSMAHGASPIVPDGPVLSHVVGSIDVGTHPQGVVLDPTTGDLYVTNQVSDNATVLNGTTDMVVGSIDLGGNPVIAAYDAANGRIYAPNYYTGNVSVIDPATASVVHSITVGSSPYSVTYDGANGRLFVVNDASRNVTVIDGSSDASVASVPVANYPYGSAFDPLTGEVYVVNLASDNVTVINGATDQISGWITLGPPVGVGPSSTTGNVLAFDPANGCLYVANNQPTGNVTVINGTTDSVVARIPVASQPDGVGYDSANGYLYVANYASNSVSVIDGSTNTVVQSLAVGGEPYGVAFDAANHFVYVTDFSTNNVTVIDGPGPQAYPVTFSETGLLAGTSWSVSLGGSSLRSTAATISAQERNGTYAFTVGAPVGYAASPASGTVVVAGAAVNVPIAFTSNGPATYPLTFTESGLPPGTNWSVTLNGIPTIPVGNQPNGIAFDSADGNLYVANTLSNNLSVIRAATGQVIGSIPVTSPYNLAYDAANGYLYVGQGCGCYRGGHTVAVVEPQKGKVVTSISVGYTPWYVLVDTANGLVYVANHDDDTVSAINASTNAVVATVPVGPGPGGMAVDLHSGYLYVADGDGGSGTTVTVINGTTNAVVTTLQGFQDPTNVQYDPETGHLYVFEAMLQAVPGFVAELDPATGQVVATAGVGVAPVGGTFDAAAGYLYVGNYASQNISVIDAATDRVVHVIPDPSGTGGIGFTSEDFAVDTANGYVYATSQATSAVIVINGATSSFGPLTASSVTDTIAFQVPVGNYSFAVSNVTGYRAAPDAGSVQVAGAPTNQPIHFVALPTPPGPFRLTSTETVALAGGAGAAGAAGVGVGLARHRRRRGRRPR